MSSYINVSFKIHNTGNLTLQLHQVLFDTRSRFTTLVFGHIGFLTFVSFKHIHKNSQKDTVMYLFLI